MYPSIPVSLSRFVGMYITIDDRLVSYILGSTLSLWSETKLIASFIPKFLLVVERSYSRRHSFLCGLSCCVQKMEVVLRKCRVRVISGKTPKWAAVVKAGFLTELWIIQLKKNKCLLNDEEWSGEKFIESCNQLIDIWLHSYCNAS